MPSIRLIIADDHRLFRQGLRHLLEQAGGFEVVGEAETGQAAVKLARALKPHIILMDVNMPGMDGVQATALITEHLPQTRVIILTMYAQDRLVFEAIKAGARGYLLKDIDEKELVYAIQAVHRGEALITSSLAGCLLDEFRQMSKSLEDQQKKEELNDIEMHILRLVAQGASNKEVAERLGFSERTVANRLSDIYSKLHVNSRTQAVLLALRKGWAELEKD